MIAQIEHARKTAAGIMLLAPQPVGRLVALQIIDAARHGRMIDPPAAIRPSSAQAVCDAVDGAGS